MARVRVKAGRRDKRAAGWFWLPVVLAGSLTEVSAADDRRLIDGVAAVVERRVITLSEVEIEGKVFLYARAGRIGLDQALDDAFRRKVLDYIIVQELLLQEAQRREGTIASEDEVDRALRALEERNNDGSPLRSALKGLGADEETLRNIMRRDLTVQAWTGVILALPPLSDNEVRAWLEAHPEHLPDADDAHRLRTAREPATQARRASRFDEHIRQLRASADLRIVARFLEEGGAGL